MLRIPGDENLVGRYLLGAHIILENRDVDGDGQEESVHLCPKRIVAHYKNGGKRGAASVVFFYEAQHMPLEIGPVINTAKSKFGGGTQRPHRSYPMMVRYRNKPLPGATVTVMVDGSQWTKSLVTDEIGYFLPTFSCCYVRARAGTCFMLTLQQTLGAVTWNGMMVLFKRFLFFSLRVIIIGRGWCGWVCPLGFFQDMLDLVRQKIGIGYIRFSSKLRHGLAWIKWIFLSVAVLIPIWVAFPLFCPCVALNLNIPYCQICPGKYILPLLVGNPARVAITFKNVTTAQCLLCLKCVENCPEPDALRAQFLGKTIYRSSSQKFFEKRGVAPGNDRCPHNQKGSKG
jgi:ferredoxin